MVSKSSMLTLVVSFASPILVTAAAVQDNESDPIVRGALGQELHAYLNAVSGEGFGGAALIAKNGEVILAHGYGLANREAGIPWTPATVFTVGSITKQFTAAAILKLEEQGKLSVDDRIRTYLDGVPRDKRKLTIHHLLTHSSGMRNGFGGDFDPVATRDWLLERAMASDLVWESKPPGEKHLYSNAGYSLLAMIVENVSGTGYEAFVRTYLFEPAGMTRTGYTLDAWAPENFAQGYLNDEDWGVVALKHALPDGPNWNLRGNGGIHSTLWDLYRWHQALLGDEILSAESKEKMYAPHVAESPGATTYYGYGWAIAETARDTKLVTHNGGNGIHFADFRRYIDEDTVVIIASNVAEHPADDYERGLLQILWAE